MEAQFTLVEKEDVGTFVFPHEEVLKTEEGSKLLKNQLDRAISLGNLEHQKVRIYFEDAKKKMVVETTIWAVTDTSIVLKQNSIIPINRIYKLEI